MTSKELNKTIGKNIKRYRMLYSIDVHKLTQKELAKKVGVSTPTIGLLESSKSSMGISIYNLYKISQILNVPINKFFE